MAKSAKKKQATDAEMIEAGLLDRDLYAGMTKAEAAAFDQETARRSVEEHCNQVAEFQKLLRFYNVEITDAAASNLLFDQVGQLGRSMLVRDSEAIKAGRILVPHAVAARRAVLDTAAANYARLAKPIISKAKQSAALRQRILAAIPAAIAEEQENARRTNTRVLVKNVNATIARMAGCKESVVEKTRRGIRHLNVLPYGR